MKENGVDPSVIRAGKANMFLSDVFAQSFVNTTGVPVELHKTDGSVGAALGAALGAGMLKEGDLIAGKKALSVIDPVHQDVYEELYGQWKELLEVQLQKIKKIDS
jgi:hypothetical protein